MRKSVICRILFGAAIIFILLNMLVSVYIYNTSIDNRYETPEEWRYSLDDFENLSRKKYSFMSNKGQSLCGYMYQASDSAKGIIVFAHGLGGGGHNSYMSCINYLASNGFMVFAYDATGNDESEGDGVNGIPQGVIDLDHAISFVENYDEFPDLPILLFGHSWGAYSVCSVLNYHPEVQAVIACSGFNKSTDIIEIQGKKEIGNGIYAMLPFMKLYEAVQFRQYATADSLSGIASTKAPIMIVQSSDDEVVPLKYGYNLFYSKLKTDERVSFVKVNKLGHNLGFEKYKTDKCYDKQSENLFNTFVDFYNKSI